MNYNNSILIDITDFPIGVDDAADSIEASFKEHFKTGREALNFFLDGGIIVAASYDSGSEQYNYTKNLVLLTNAAHGMSNDAYSFTINYRGSETSIFYEGNE